MASLLDLSQDQQDQLRCVADAIAAPGKRVLVEDENTGNMGKLLADSGEENIKENRCKYWQFLNDECMESRIKGVILFHETVFQNTDDGMPFTIPSSYQNNGITPGIEIEKSIVPSMETEDLNNLAQRCQKYKSLGCQFINWHCALKITSNTSLAIQNLANLLALCASTCQQKSLVPILHPEILWESAPDTLDAQKATEDILSAVYEALSKHHVYLEGTLLKLNIVTAGQSFNEKYTLVDVVEATITALRKTVPQSVPGVFLSGGHSEEEATAYWSAIHKYAGQIHWALSFVSDHDVYASALEPTKEMRLGKTDSSTFAETPYWRVDYAHEISRLLEEIPMLFKKAKKFMGYPVNYKVREEFVHEHRDIYSTEGNRGKTIGVQTFGDSTIATNSEPERSTKEKKAKKIQNLLNAVNYMFGKSLYVKTLKHQFNTDLAKELHKIIGEELFDNAGSYRNSDAKPSREDFSYLSPHKIEESMERLFKEVNEDFDSKRWFETAGIFFAKFLLIHPFSNGNGRTARILLSALLRNYAIVPVCLFSAVEKNSNEVYLDCVRQAQRYDNYSLLYSLIIENTHFGLHNFLKRF